MDSDRGRSLPPVHYSSKASQPYIEMKCGLGEAPFYETSTHSLRFVDIENEKLHVVDLAKGPSSLKSYDLGTSVRFTCLHI